MIEKGLELATLIASKSPIAVQGSKINLVYSRDRTVDEGLHFMVVFHFYNRLYQLFLGYYKIFLILVCLECVNVAIRGSTQSCYGCHDQRQSKVLQIVRE